MTSVPVKLNAVPQYGQVQAFQAHELESLLLLAHLIESLGPKLFLFNSLMSMPMPRAPNPDPMVAQFETCFPGCRVYIVYAPLPQQQKTNETFQNTFSQRKAPASGSTQWQEQPRKKQDYARTPPAPPKTGPQATPDVLNFMKANGVQGATNGDAYSFLGVTSQTSVEEIKKAYKKMALKFHPDRHSTTPETRKEAEEAFKEIQDAYDTIKIEKKFS